MLDQFVISRISRIIVQASSTTRDSTLGGAIMAYFLKDDVTYPSEYVPASVFSEYETPRRIHKTPA